MSVVHFFDSKIMLPLTLFTHIIYLKTFVWISSKITEHGWKKMNVLQYFKLWWWMKHIAFGLQFYNLSPLLLEAMYENLIDCLFWLLNHIDWIVASRKQFKCNCIASAFVKRKKSKVPKGFRARLTAVMANFCHKGSSVLFCRTETKNIQGFT